MEEEKIIRSFQIIVSCYDKDKIMWGDSACGCTYSDIVVNKVLFEIGQLHELNHVLEIGHIKIWRKNFPGTLISEGKSPKVGLNQAILRTYYKASVVES